MAALASCQSKLSHNQLTSTKKIADNATDLRHLLRCDVFPIDDGLGYCTNDLGMSNKCFIEIISTIDGMDTIFTLWKKVRDFGTYDTKFNLFTNISYKFPI